MSDAQFWDYVLAACQVVLAASLLPALWWGPAPHWLTCLGTALTAFVVVVALVGLGARWSALVVLVMVVEWLLLMMKSLRKR